MALFSVKVEDASQLDKSHAELKRQDSPHGLQKEAGDDREDPVEGAVYVHANHGDLVPRDLCVGFLCAHGYASPSSVMVCTTSARVSGSHSN